MGAKLMGLMYDDNNNFNNASKLSIPNVEIPIYNLKGIMPSCFGGVKTVYPINDELVVFMPNLEDGQKLINEWPRIMEEEFLLSEQINKLNIPTLTFNKCKIETDNGLFDTFCSQSFFSFVKNNNYIIDCKNKDSCQFSKYKNLSLFDTSSFQKENDKYDASKWFEMMNSLINDFKTLYSNNLYLRQESHNCVFVAKNSKWHSGISNECNLKLPFEIRLFMFDFASKYHLYKQNKNVHKSDEFDHFKSNIKNIIKVIIFEELNPTAFCLNKKQNKLCDDITEMCCVKFLEKS